MILHSICIPVNPLVNYLNYECPSLIFSIIANGTKLVWLDSDPGINVGVLDDVIAILLAGFHPNLKLLGISTVAGNTDVDNCTKNAQNVLNFFNLNVVFLLYL